MTTTRPNFAPTALAIAISLSAANLHAANLPTGGNIVGGSGSISQDGNSLNVQQNSDKLITNWDSFDIGAGHTVNFYQPGSNSVALNRVIGEDASAIYGNLNANGKVFLVNPNGVLFGQGAAVNVGALVASTLSLSDEDFNNGDYQFQGDGNNAAVINRGTLNADQGAVALLGGQVSNHGIIQANQGTVALAAGDKITLDFAGDGLLNVTVDKGTIDALVENHQLVRANGGQVIMTANATNALLQTVVNNTGIVEAQTLDNQNGTIVLKGGFNGGTVNVAGTLDASAPDSGDGGFIDTSGAHVKIAGGTQVTTKANNGTTGEWLIDPTDFTISDSSDPQTASGIGADTLSANLANNSVTLQTVASGSEAGDINVQAAVTWNADTTLTLEAHNDININAAITAQGANGKVALQYGQATHDGGTADYHINAPINLQSGNNFSTQKGSTGSVISYTVVNDAAALQAMNSDLTANYAVGSNIDLSSISNWQPVGESDRFTGTFNGLGHTLSNLTIDRSSTDFVGLFGATASGSVIRDIGLVGGSVSGRNHVGGLVGVSSGTISNAYATGSVEGSGRVGGLVGFNQSGIINSVYATGSVKGTNDYVGGLVGYNQGDISNAYATGDVEGSSDSVGGLAGYNSAATISNAYATGSVEGYEDVGGLVGFNQSGTINDAYATGSVKSSYDFAGGLIGVNSGTISNAYATGSVEGYYYVGGLVGRNQSGTINSAYATGSVKGSRRVGGLIGDSQGTTSNAYATGSVEGYNSVGGLVGFNQGAIISNAYASGSVKGSLRVGGLVGYNWFGSIRNAYATGSVESDSVAGGLIGFNSSNTVTNSYWNTETSGQTSAVGMNDGPITYDATGLTSAQLMQADSFAGWDIDTQGGTGTVWRIYEGYTAPLLRHFLTALEVTGDTTTTTYNGIEQSGSWSATSEYDSDRIFGQVGGGRNAGTYTLDMNGLYSDQQGYDLITTNGTLTINKAQATVTANSGTTTYNGTEQSVSGFTVDGLVNGEDASVLSGVTTNGGKGTNAGSYVLTVGGGSADNYVLNFVDGILTINKAQVTVTANSSTTTYNGTEQSVSGFTVEGLVNGEDQSVLDNITTSGGKGTNAGTYVLTANGSDGNYELTFVDGALTINKAKATVTANSATTTYNGTEQSVDGFTVEGLVNGEDQSVLDNITTSGGKGTNAGTYVLTANGSDGNYELTFVDGALTINKAKATVTANSATTTYNGTEQSVDGFTVEGLVNGEDQSVLDNITTSGGKGTNAGTYLLTANGSDGNYELTFVDGALTINKAKATVTANSGTTTYNGTEQSVEGFTVEGLVNGEDASVLSGVTTSGGKGTNAGNYTLTASGTDGNYELTFVDGTLTINKAQATVTANSGTTTYNGTEQSVSGFTVDGLVNGEDASVLSGVTTSGGKGTNAGSYVLTVSGGSADNYELIFVDGTLTINKAQATVTANSGTTTYNGTEQSVSGFTVDGLVNGEDQSVLTGVTTNGGKGTNAGSYVLTVSGGSADNYELSFVDGTLTINKAQATVTANSGTTTYNGTEQSGSGFTVNGLVNGEDASVLSGVTISGGGRDAGTYVLTASGSDGNYALTFVDGTLTINKAQATVTANSDTTAYNGTEQSVSGFTVDGLVNGENASVLTGVTTSGGTGTNAGTYVLTASGSDGNYELTFVDGALTIDRKTITADIRALDKLFDGSLAATLEGVLNGTISGDDVALQLSGLFASLTPGENRVLVDASLTGADAGNYQLIAPDSVTANMRGFVQSADYQSAIVSQPPQPRPLRAADDAGYVLDIDDDALRLTGSGQ